MNKYNHVQKMFELLNKSIGKQVTITYWSNKEKEKIVDKIYSVHDYEYIMTYDKMAIIPFLSLECAIISIIDEDGNILYGNKYVSKKFKTPKNNFQLFRLQKLSYGKQYINPEQFRDKTFLINRGLREINPLSKDKWIDFVKKSDMQLIQATISMLNKINNGMSFYEAEIKVLNQEFNNCTFDIRELDNAILEFSTKSYDFEHYLDGMRNNIIISDATNKSPKILKAHFKTR